MDWLILMMKASRSFETSRTVYTSTRCNIPKIWNYRNTALRTTNFTNQKSYILVGDMQSNINTEWVKICNAPAENKAQSRAEQIELQYVLNVAQHRHVREATYVIWNVLSMGLTRVQHMYRGTFDTLCATCRPQLHLVNGSDALHHCVIWSYAEPHDLLS